MSLEPSDAQIMLDGNPAQLRSGDELWVDPGTHQLTVSANGFNHLELRLVAKPGDQPELDLRLAPQAVAVPSSEVMSQPEPTREPAAQPSKRSPVPYIVAGSGAALLIAATVTGVMSSSKHSALQEECDVTTGQCPDRPGIQDDIDSGRRLALATDIMLITGIAAVGTGVVLWFLMGPDSEAPAPATSASLGCSPDGCYGSVRSRF